ncbi:YjeO family protein [Kosakonia sp. H02]|nr:YjeO family protein [Kosakonia sp. H02]
MRWRGFTLGFVWFWLSILLISLFSMQDKEWFIDGDGIKNICDLITYIESDDIRDVGIVITIPLFFPFIYLLIWKKKHHWFLYLIFLSVFAFWLWRFFLRYKLCL